jgi:hypothetical protein
VAHSRRRRTPNDGEMPLRFALAAIVLWFRREIERPDMVALAG